MNGVEARRLGALVLGCLAAGAVPAYWVPDGGLVGPRPIHTQRCLVEGRFDCLAAEDVYSVRGLSCVEDCLVFDDRLNICHLTNRCRWDVGSGCFVKEVCVDVSRLHLCRRWERQVVCE